MAVSIFPPKRSDVPPFETPFALKQDNWNDYSFRTLYHLYRRQSEPGAAPTLIGSVKILRRGQTNADGIRHFHASHWRPVLLLALAQHDEFCTGAFRDVLPPISN